MTASAATVLIDIEGIEVARGHGANAFRLAIDHFRLDRGDAVVVAGPSGCGKSTLLDVLGLVLRPKEFRRFVMGAGQDVGGLWREGKDSDLARLRASDIGYVLQTGGVLPFLDVKANISLNLNLLRRRDDRHVDYLVERLGLVSALGKMPRALSIGERQRVAIARALAHRPSLILADEPTAALDPVNARAVTGLLLELAKEAGCAVIIVSHDADLAQRHHLRRVGLDGASGMTRIFHPSADSSTEVSA